MNSVYSLSMNPIFILIMDPGLQLVYPKGLIMDPGLQLLYPKGLSVE